MKQSKVIGITGGIGAGKSRVIRWLSDNYSVCLIEADRVGAELMEPGKSVYGALLKEFGEQILGEDGRIDKASLSKIAFRDEESQQRVNALEHPLIRDEIRRRITSTRHRFVLLEAALLFEGGLAADCQEVWYVRTSEEIRIERLMSSRGYTREKCEAILALQLSDEEFLKAADAVIDNGRDFGETASVLASEMKRLGVPAKRGAAPCR